MKATIVCKIPGADLDNDYLPPPTPESYTPCYCARCTGWIDVRQGEPAALLTDAEQRVRCLIERLHAVWLAGAARAQLASLAGAIRVIARAHGGKPKRTDTFVVEEDASICTTTLVRLLVLGGEALGRCGTPRRRALREVAEVARDLHTLMS